MTKPPHHIALFLPSLRGGGAERVMVIIANGLVARGHKVDLVLAKAEGPYLQEVSPDIRIVDFDKERVLRTLLPLAGYLRREKPDAVLSAMNHANIIAILARQLAGISTNLVVSEHNAPSKSLGSGRLAWLMRGLIRQFYPLADGVVCVSKGVETELQNNFGLKTDILSTIYNPIDIQAIDSKMDEPVQHPWIQDRQAPVIIAAGRLTAQKDYPTLLSAFAELRKTTLAKLVILGVGEDEIALKAFATEKGVSEHVDFVGFQSNPFAWMAKCDLYVMSSAWEGMGNVLAEAMACGRNVVSTDCVSGPSEILEGGRWGRLVTVGDARALAQAMAEALDDPSPPEVRMRAIDFASDTAVGLYETLLFTHSRRRTL